VVPKKIQPQWGRKRHQVDRSNAFTFEEASELAGHIGLTAPADIARLKSDLELCANMYQVFAVYRSMLGEAAEIRAQARPNLGGISA